MKRAMILPLLFVIAGCPQSQPPTSISGAKQAKTTITTNSAGHTVEQENIIDRIKMDNTPGSLKHLYVFSTYSGQCLLYSPVRGKVTSSGKRLSPSNVRALRDELPFSVNIGGQTFYTNELLGDDGVYGSSIEYLFWFTPDGVYHQHYLGGGQIVHVSNEPVAVKNVMITIESKPEPKK
jgi:hypothetical protein